MIFDNFRHGGWILDNFPQSRDQWSVCIEKNILPDDILVLKDNDAEFLLKRYYVINRQDIDGKIKARKDAEAEKKRLAEEERL